MNGLLSFVAAVHERTRRAFGRPRPRSTPRPGRGQTRARRAAQPRRPRPLSRSGQPCAWGSGLYCVWRHDHGAGSNCEHGNHERSNHGISDHERNNHDSCPRVSLFVCHGAGNGEQSFFRTTDRASSDHQQGNHDNDAWADAERGAHGAPTMKRAAMKRAAMKTATMKAATMKEATMNTATMKVAVMAQRP